MQPHATVSVSECCTQGHDHYVVKVVVVDDAGNEVTTARFPADSLAEAQSIAESLKFAAEVGADVLMAMLGP